MNLNKEALAWAAGFFDGEGNTGWLKNCPVPRLTITQSGSLELLERFKLSIGGFGTVGPNKRKSPAHYKPQWLYRLNDFEHAQAVIGFMWIWLGSAKRRQAASAMEQYRIYCTTSLRQNWGWSAGKCQNSHDITDPTNVLVSYRGLRRCKPCSRQRQSERVNRISGGILYVATPINHPSEKKVIAIHRLLMEKWLRRPLCKGERVYFKNRNRKDLRIENLGIVNVASNFECHKIWASLERD